VVCRNVCRREFNPYAYWLYVGTSVGVSLTRMRIGGMSERLSAWVQLVCVLVVCRNVCRREFNPYVYWWYVRTSADCQREFCSKCGNKTLSRVTVSYNDDGTVQYFLSRYKRYSSRGLRVSPHHSKLWWVLCCIYIVSIFLIGDDQSCLQVIIITSIGRPAAAQGSMPVFCLLTGPKIRFSSHRGNTLHR